MAAVIKELQESHASGRYSKQQCYDLQGEINYFTANQQRMDYPLYRSCGLPIGSGVVEGACKNVVANPPRPSSRLSDRYHTDGMHPLVDDEGTCRAWAGYAT